ncbi:SMI1/KNR4 family protein [Amycolatopsis minnesotensis]|uniref:Knr4/Smi1-like domain-containing protein n=1 Tax=Amycolatopsis minnesotensis TaxID=337894 RepID=A0ABN2R7W0_9PSEU
MDTEVTRLWHQIMTVLRDQAPITAQAIRPPAPSEDVEHLQHLIGLDFPADLRAWWTLMDGIDDQGENRTGNRVGHLLPKGFVPLSVAQAEKEYTHQLNYPAHDCCTPDGTHREKAGATGFPFCSALVPLCRNILGGLLCVDLRPGDDHGCIVEWYAAEGFYPSDWADVTDLLNEVSEGLEDYSQGLELSPYETRPFVHEGMLKWP